MEAERIALSQRERDRLKVLHEVKQKHLTQLAAAKRLKVTDRQVRRMLLRLRERGDRSLAHGLRGRPSNRKLAARLEQRILARSADFCHRIRNDLSPLSLEFETGSRSPEVSSTAFDAQPLDLHSVSLMD
jgi:predicted ArsR family transcriptional regulator